jgi:hypothetical protein
VAGDVIAQVSGAGEPAAAVVAEYGVVTGNIDDAGGVVFGFLQVVGILVLNIGLEVYLLTWFRKVCIKVTAASASFRWTPS